MSQIFWKMNLRQPDPVKHEPLSLEMPLVAMTIVYYTITQCPALTKGD